MSDTESMHSLDAVATNFGHNVRKLMVASGAGQKIKPMDLSDKTVGGLIMSELLIFIGSQPMENIIELHEAGIHYIRNLDKELGINKEADNG